MTLTSHLPGGLRGRLLALGIALCGALLLWAGAVAPVLDWYDSRQDELSRQQAISLRMAALVRTLPALQAAADSTAARSAARRVVLLEGATDAVAAAGLQQRLEEMAGHAELRIGSAEVMPAETIGGFHAIAVRATVTAPWPALIRLLHAIAAADTPMLTENLQIRSLPHNVQETTLPIDVTFTVIGYRAGGPPGSATAAFSKEAGP